MPQGSVLGPLLFIIYINDLDSGLSSNICKFADDTKIGREINSEEDSLSLQVDLDRVLKWSKDWQMQFNADKYKVLRLGNDDRVTRYELDGVVIAKSDCERDLGVMISKNLKQKDQCINVRNKANRTLGFINRSVSNKTPGVVLKLYLALVRPHLDYAVQFWSPYYRMDINSLERVQRRMTKLIPQIRNLSYEERLTKLKLHSLERRRVRGDMIEVYKWMNGHNRGDINRVLKVSTQDRTRNNGYKLDKFRFRKDLGKYWFSNRVVDLWNQLPRNIVEVGSLDCFKHGLDKYMSGIGWL